DAEPHKVRHWFFVQDGGFPVDVEPALGVFRSPLWLGRNAFREEKRPPSKDSWPPKRKDDDPDAHDHVEHAAASQQVGYASLPIEALTNLISGLTRGTPERGMAEVSELGAQRLHRLSEAEDEGNGDAGEGPWKLLPTQLDDALEKLKQRALDTVGLATEGIVSSFLEDAANSVSKELYAGLGAIVRTSDGLPSVLKHTGKINIAQLDDIRKLDLARGGLRLGVQLLWGSQSGLARAIGDQLWETTFTGRGKLAEAGVDLLKRLLDYRLGNGRAAMLLSMGLDSAPGRLQLDLPAEPRFGSELLGQNSGSRAYVVGTILDEGTSFGSGTAAGSLLVADATTPFEPGEVLFAGRKKVGRVETDEPVVDRTSTDAQRPMRAVTGLGLRALRFKPAKPGGSVSPALRAPLRAKLPEAIDTPERGVQERVLRDIASAWDGELRTDPLWTFFDRRITVHPQGGCPMGPADRAVTKPTGEVYGCEGLYVMDAAAFPGPVGTNPSATIAAIAEYKVAKFIERSAGEKTQLLNPNALEGLPRAFERLQEEREKAVAWVDAEGRELLDPLRLLPSNPSSVEPAHQPVGIEFTERMEGTIERDGWQPIQTELTVRIDDLAEFLARHARGVEVRIPIIEGTLAIGNERKLIREQKRASDPPEHSGGNGKPKGDKWILEPHESYMVVMARPGLDNEGNEVRTIEYHLVTRNGRRILEGKKTIRDDPGFDAWEDTTWLDIEALTEFNKKGKKIGVSKGELLLPAQAFFDMQLPSFKADTDDPARQMWAMATFGRFFFGHLAAVYLPELDRLGGLASNLMRRGHG
ncbi:MAG: GMC family oxidoreductase, partial [Myxococcales bacterium]|nr:GMC family oxidoreductase [Myxococcales bacterium]